jgi:hypothetical protein
MKVIVIIVAIFIWIISLRYAFDSGANTGYTKAYQYYFEKYLETHAL